MGLRYLLELATVLAVAAKRMAVPANALRTAQFGPWTAAIRTDAGITLPSAARWGAMFVAPLSAGFPDVAGSGGLERAGAPALIEAVSTNVMTDPAKAEAA